MGAITEYNSNYYPLMDKKKRAIKVLAEYMCVDGTEIECCDTSLQLAFINRRYRWYGIDHLNYATNRALHSQKYAHYIQ